MTSARKIRSNRANARSSTGPKTVKGRGPLEHILGASLDAASHGLRALPEVRLEQLSDADSRLGRDLLSTGLDRSADRGRARLIDDLRHERLFARWARVPRLLPMPWPARDIYLL
jgi:hypothetical protein